MRALRDGNMNEDELTWMFLGGLSDIPDAGRDGIIGLFSWEAYDHMIDQAGAELERLIWLYQVPAQGSA